MGETLLSGFSERVGSPSQTAAPRLRGGGPGLACLLPAEAVGTRQGLSAFCPGASSPSLGDALPRAPEGGGDPGQVSAVAPGQGRSIEAGHFPTRVGRGSEGLGKNCYFKIKFFHFSFECIQ